MNMQPLTADEPEPGGAERAIGALFEHSEVWGKVWFGLIFWGSVLYALAVEFWADANRPVLLVVSLAIGLTAGVFAKSRGRWL